MAAYINLSLQGTVYFAARRSAEDDAMLQLYSSRLVGVARESTFDVLYSRIARDWHQQDDVSTPSNDRRWTHVRTVWNFDLDGDILRLDKIDRNLWVPLSLIRQRSITISDFEPYEPPPTLAKHALQSVYSAPCWRMRRKEIDLQRLQRRKTFVSRILADFAFQWRHIICSRYNNSTFRRLAYAIVRIVTLDFTVEEATLSRPGTGGFLVWINNIPEWDFASGHIVRVGGTSIVICQHVPHAITLVRKDYAKRILSTPGSADKTLTYLILSVRELILYRINSEVERYTESKRLFDGTYPPSEEAIEILLQATQTNILTTPLHKLPIELQDAILDKVSAGPIESARVGCLLDAGSVFTWRSGKRKIEREEGRRCRSSCTPVESQILFGGYPSGIAYK
ncbi:uncharacterized protein K460DRAFT_349078 [Cucurbitaria berberidis CBS 394.84]|uniref:Uncharacterized protein n=1 Tax=Cucurbitaria berberidis CBS 394.84 TaxID=1168544 RepID=A0A9P4L3L9_9PLEO|nr:uncharacterized protein K460DRAFT_349078 [Cucurbitaria berberidis CBS 394.84]KAF1840530.1 hypothetical protein K460DRAFT_349078 [Cucurbitaria berberidis CBS 394.84]